MYMCCPRSDCQVWSMLISECHAPRTSRSPHPPHWTCQLGICFSWIPGSSALRTRIRPELPSDSVPQLVRAWQAICRFAGSSPSLSHCQFLFPLYFSLYFFLSLWLWLSLRSDCQVWSMLIFECHAPHASRSPHPLLPQSKSLSYASVWMFALIASNMSSSRMKSVLFICGAWLSC